VLKAADGALACPPLRSAFVRDVNFDSALNFHLLPLRLYGTVRTKFFAFARGYMKKGFASLFVVCFILS
jgi:hypothetical protein